MAEERKRTLKLLCPSLSKVVPFVAWEEQRLDLGSIARTFGLDPSTLKLNGHFISRGVDLIASSVTWKSLLSFFSSRGLSTGATDSDALIVDGKLSKIGTKRAHDPTEVRNGMSCSREQIYSSAYGKTQLEDTSNKIKRFKGSTSVADKGEQKKCNNLSLKRKLPLEDDDNPLKRLRMRATQAFCFQDSNAKPVREDEIFLPLLARR